MPRVKITLDGFRCERCEHEWVPRESDHEPRTCPACKSPYWDVKRGTNPRGRPKGTA